MIEQLYIYDKRRLVITTYLPAVTAEIALLINGPGYVKLTPIEGMLICSCRIFFSFLDYYQYFAQWYSREL